VSNPKKDMEVCQFLERLLSEIFPGCKALAFGSRVSGLAFSDSDLDIFLDTGNNNCFSRFEVLTAVSLKVKIL
jgi:DNA polymerase sigma